MCKLCSLYNLINVYICCFPECPLNWVVPPTIPFNNVKCALTQNCTRIDCCVDFSLLNLRLHFFLHFDRCNYVISGGIEKKTFSYGLLDFNNFWGKFHIYYTWLRAFQTFAYFQCTLNYCIIIVSISQVFKFFAGKEIKTDIVNIIFIK